MSFLLGILSLFVPEELTRTAQTVCLLQLVLATEIRPLRRVVEIQLFPNSRVAARLQEDARKRIDAGAMARTVATKPTVETRSLTLLVVLTLRLFDNVLALNPFSWHASS